MEKKPTRSDNSTCTQHKSIYSIVCGQTDWLLNELSVSRPVSLQTSVEISLGQANFFMVPHDVLVLFRGSSEPFLAVLAAMRIVFCMNGDNVPFKA